jgi:hypothetical protein
MPGLDPGIHAVSSQLVEAPVEWIAGATMSRRKELKFSGFIGPQRKFYLRYHRIDDVPYVTQPPPSTPFLKGELKYHVAYRAAPNGQVLRETGRDLSFEIPHAPPVGAVGTKPAYPLIINATNQLEK